MTDRETIKTMWKANSDGAGLCYVENGKVVEFGIIVETVMFEQQFQIFASDDDGVYALQLRCHVTI